MSQRAIYVGLFVCLICLLSGSITSVMALNLNVDDDPEQLLGRTSLHPADSIPLSSIPCVDGMADIYRCKNIDLVAFMPLSQLSPSGMQGNDIWGWTDPQTGDEYALMGVSDGTSFVRITDPENPILVGFLPTHTTSSMWRDIKVYNDHAFIVSEARGHGMQLFDLTQLSAITATTSISPTTIFSHTAHYGEFGKAHNLVINEETGYAYPVGADICEGGLHFINITDLSNLQNEGCFDADGYTHDAQCVIYNGLDTEHVGKEICFNSNTDTLTIVDVTDKSNPVQLSRTTYANTGYTHQGWLTEDHAYFLLNDELDEQILGLPTQTFVWDVADLDAPFVETTYTTGSSSVDHNLYTRGDSAFLSNYTSGLRVLSISDPTIPVEIGYFDVHPENDNPNLSGAWSNYPYFESGTVIVSSIERGLFLLRPQSFALAASSKTVVSCDGSPVTTSFAVRSFFDAADTIALTATASGDSMAVLSTNSLLIGTSGELTLTPSTTGENGTAQITGILGDKSATTQISIIQAAPSAPRLDASLNFAGISSFSETFIWKSAPTATSYLLEISDASDFANIIFSAEVAETSRKVDGLPANQVLYWRVSAVNACGSTLSAVQTVISLATTEQCGSAYDEQFEGQVPWRTVVFEPDPSEVTIPYPWALGATGAYSGTSGWSFTDTGFTGSFISPPTIPANGTSATLRFWQKRDLGTDDAVMLAYYNGQTIVPIDNEQMSEPFDHPIEGWGEFSAFPVVGWSGVQDWTETIIDVSPYISPRGTLNIFFMAFTGDEASNATDAWAIDDVSLEVCAQPIIPVDLSTFADSYGLAWHTGDGIQYIGSSWSSEQVISTTDTSDDLMLPALRTDQENALMVDVAQNGWLMGWFDWNGDGQFSDDELTVDQAVISGTNGVEFSVPADTLAGDIAYRFRVTLDSASPALPATGFAADGEVEDGFVKLSSTTAVTMSSYKADTAHIHPTLLILLGFTLVGTFALSRGLDARWHHSR